jgi:hypothetical protein
MAKMAMKPTPLPLKFFLKTTAVCHGRVGRFYMLLFDHFQYFIYHLSEIFEMLFFFSVVFWSFIQNSMIAQFSTLIHQNWHINITNGNLK